MNVLLGMRGAALAGTGFVAGEDPWEDSDGTLGCIRHQLRQANRRWQQILAGLLKNESSAIRLSAADLPIIDIPRSISLPDRAEAEDLWGIVKSFCGQINALFLDLHIQVLVDRVTIANASMRYLNYSTIMEQSLFRLENLMLQYRYGTDPLTGAATRHQMHAQITAELDRTRREGTCCALAMLDLDHFKQVNDLYGHLAGDMVLQQSTQRWKSCLRPYDKLFRYGGEEFIILFPAMDIVGALAVLRRLRAAQQAVFDVPGQPGFHVTFSAGLVASSSKATIEQMILSADRALYRAKRAGRNRVMFDTDT